MKRQLLMLAVMLFAVTATCFAQAKETIYAEVKAEGSNYTLSFKVSTDANFKPQANSDGTGTYNLPTAENKLTYADATKTK